MGIPGIGIEDIESGQGNIIFNMSDNSQKIIEFPELPPGSVGVEHIADQVITLSKLSMDVVTELIQTYPDALPDGSIKPTHFSIDVWNDIQQDIDDIILQFSQKTDGKYEVTQIAGEIIKLVHLSEEVRNFISSGGGTEGPMGPQGPVGGWSGWSKLLIDWCYPV